MFVVSGKESRCRRRPVDGMVPSLARDSGKEIENGQRLRPRRVIDVRLGLNDGPVTGHDEAGRQRQRPGCVVVESFEIDAKPQVHLPQILRQGKDQPELCGKAIARVAEEGKGQVEPFDDLLGIFFKLRRNSEECGPGLLDAAGNLLQSLQLRIAIRSPHAAVEADDQRPPSQQFVRADRSSLFVPEGEHRRRLATLEHAIKNAGTAQVIGRPGHDGSSLRRYSRRRFFLQYR